MIEDQQQAPQNRQKLACLLLALGMFIIVNQTSYQVFSILTKQEYLTDSECAIMSQVQVIEYVKSGSSDNDECFLKFFTRMLDGNVFKGQQLQQDGQIYFVLSRVYEENQVSLAFAVTKSQYFDEREFTWVYSLNLKNSTYKNNQLQLFQDTDIANCSTKVQIYYNQSESKNLLAHLKFDIEIDHQSTKYRGSAYYFEDLEYKALIYSFMNTVLSVVMMISCLKIFRGLVIENDEQPDDYSIFVFIFMLMQDSFLSALNFHFAMNLHILFQYFITPSFLYFILFSVFEFRLIIILWKARNHAISIVIFYIMICIIFYNLDITIFLSAFVFWHLTQSNLFIFILSFYLVPQIIHHAIKGQHVRFNSNLVFGVMLPRIFIIIYFRGYSNNIFDLKPNLYLVLSILISFTAQIIIYYYQNVFGPQYFVPSIFLPKKYNYFMKVPVQFDLEAGAPSEFQFLFQEDCSVCMGPLHSTPTLILTDQEKSNYTINNIINKQKGNIMKTPCDHKFHVICLAKWMAIKLTCPSCRQELPPI